MYFLLLLLYNRSVLLFHFIKDYSINMETIKELTVKFQPQIVIVESGGDNLAANFSRELADYIIYVIDVAGILLYYKLCGSG